MASPQTTSRRPGRRIASASHRCQHQRELTGRELKRIRLDTLDMTQEELGKEIGVTRGTVILYEQGKLKITRTVELAVLYLVKHGSRRR